MNPHTDVTSDGRGDRAAPSPDPAHVAIWIALNRARLSVMRDVDKTLREMGLPPLTWYDVLWSVEKRGGTARPTEIMEDLLFEPSALSHMVKRMETAGLLQICVASGDRRGRALHITATGLQARAAIWQVYGAALETRLRPLKQLTDRRSVADALNAVVGS